MQKWKTHLFLSVLISTAGHSCAWTERNIDRLQLWLYIYNDETIEIGCTHSRQRVCDGVSWKSSESKSFDVVCVSVFILGVVGAVHLCAPVRAHVWHNHRCAVFTFCHRLAGCNEFILEDHNYVEHVTAVPTTLTRILPNDMLSNKRALTSWTDWTRSRWLIYTRRCTQTLRLPTNYHILIIYHTLSLSLTHTLKLCANACAYAYVYVCVFTRCLN